MKSFRKGVIMGRQKGRYVHICGTVNTSPFTVDAIIAFYKEFELVGNFSKGPQKIEKCYVTTPCRHIYKVDYVYCTLTILKSYFLYKQS